MARGQQRQEQQARPAAEQKQRTEDHMNKKDKKPRAKGGPKPRNASSERVFVAWDDAVKGQASQSSDGQPASSIGQRSSNLAEEKGPAQANKSKNKKKGKNQQSKRTVGRDDFEEDALIGGSDEDDSEVDADTFGGSKFVMLDIEDELEELVLEASAGGGGNAGRRRLNAAFAKPKRSKAKLKEEKSAKGGDEGRERSGKKKTVYVKKTRTTASTTTEVFEQVEGDATALPHEGKKSNRQSAAVAASREGKRQGEHKTARDHASSRGGQSDKAPAGNGNRSKGKQDTKSQSRSDAARGRPGNDRSVYTEYLTRDDVTRGLEDGSLLQGKLRVNEMYRMDGYVTVDGISMDILVKGMEDRNRAVHSDLVVIKLHPEAEWKALGDAKADADDNDNQSKTSIPRPSPLLGADIDETALHSLWRPNVDSTHCILQRSADKESVNAPNKQRLAVANLNQQIQKCRSRPTAVVVFILAAGNANGYIGTLEPKSKVTDVNATLPGDDNYAYFNAQDQRLPRRIHIPRLQLPDEFIRRPVFYSKTMLCFCRIKSWATEFRSPMGEFVRTVGEYTGIETGISAILSKNGLQDHTVDFDSAILEELDAKYGTSGEKWQIPEEELHKRRDFRDFQIFSIDPYNARDLDDALHIRALDDDRTTFEVGVHIADVTHFVEPHSLLDKEAQSRATSVYLPNRVLPMLPRILCEKLCSLQPQVDRLAFSVVWQMKVDGTLVDGVQPWFGKSIIRSCCKLDYGSAQKMLDGAITAESLDEWEVDRRPIPGENPKITNATVIQSVKDLWAIGENRRAMRFETGAISLNDIKIVFSLDSKGNPTQFGSYQIKDSNRLVEEYMLLANYLVAQQLLHAHGPLAFIRHHPEPVARAMELALGLLNEHAFDIDGTTTKRLSDSLDQVRQRHGETTFAIVQALLIKPMKPAEYMVAGNGASPESWRHYALNIPYYTHFTSPIRRYADVIVHRLLQESVVNASTSELPVPGASNLEARLLEYTSVAQNCNEKKMTSKAAEKECDEVFLCAYVKHLGAVDVTGVVMSLGQKSFTVHILELGLERRLFLNDLHITGSWNEKAKTLTIEVPPPNKKGKKANKAKRNGDSDTTSTPPTDGSKVEEEAAPTTKQLLQLSFMKQVRLRMSATTKMPLALKFALIGAA